MENFIFDVPDRAEQLCQKDAGLFAVACGEYAAAHPGEILPVRDIRIRMTQLDAERKETEAIRQMEEWREDGTRIVRADDGEMSVKPNTSPVIDDGSTGEIYREFNAPDTSGLLREHIEKFTAGLRPSQKFYPGGLRSFIEDENSKYTLFDLTTGVGKTYLTILTAMMSNLAGNRFVYASDRKNIVRDAMQEMMNSQKNSGLETLYHRNNTLLYIPSVEDGYLHFFGIPEEGNVCDTLLPEVLPRDIAELQELIERYYHLSDSGKGLKGISMMQLEILGGFMQKMPIYLKGMNDKTVDLGDELRETYRQKYTGMERLMRNFLGRVCMAECGDDVIELINRYPAVAKLYPGTRFRTAHAVYMTFSKTDCPIELFGEYGGSTLEGIDSGISGNNIIFLDEIDLYCSRLMGTIVDEAVKHSIDMFTFIDAVFTHLRTILRIPGESIVKMDNEAIEERIRSQDLDLNKKMYIRKPADVKDEDVGEKTTNITIKKLCEAYNKFVSFYDGWGIRPGVKTKYEYREPDGVMHRLPCLGQFGQGRAYTFNTSKGKHVVVETAPGEIKLVEKNTPDNGTFIIPEADAAGEAHEKSMQRFSRHAESCVNRALSVIRLLCAVAETNEASGFATVPSFETVCSVCDVFGLADTDYVTFVRNNMFTLHTAKMEQRTGKADAHDTYELGLGLIRLQDSDVHRFSTRMCSLRTPYLPDYRLAHMVAGNKKAILASGTVKLQSLDNVDLEYLKSKVSSLVSRGGVSVPASEICFEFPGLNDGVEAARKEEASRLPDADRRKCFYYNRGKDKKGGYDLLQYRMATGTECPARYIRYDEQGKLDHGTGRLCFAVAALDRMVEYGCHTGLLYEGALPSDGSSYCEGALGDAARLIAARHGLDEQKVKIYVLSSKNVEKMRRKLEEGVADDEYILMCSQQAATGAGTNLSFRMESDGYILDGEYDIQAIFLGKPTNIIPGPPSVMTEENVSAALLTAMGAVLKFQNTCSPVAKFSHGLVNGSLNAMRCISNGMQNFSRNFTPEDARSPYHQTIAARIQQMFARINRMKLKGGVLLWGVTSDLVMEGAITEEMYRGVSTSVLFDEFVSRVEQWYREGLEKPEGITEYSDLYVEQNTAYTITTMKRMEEMESYKKAGKCVPDIIIRRDEMIRKNALTMGYGAASADGFLRGPDGRGVSGFGVILGTGHGLSDMERQCGACLAKSGIPQDFASGRQIIHRLKFAYDNSFIGDEELEKYFPDIWNNRDKIEKNGWGMVPYTETVYIFNGIFNEQLFSVYALTGGILDAGRKPAPLPSERYEDADFIYEGTRIMIDVKGYNVPHSPATEERLEEKLSRAGEGSTMIFMNMGCGDCRIERKILPSGKEYWYVNGMGSYAGNDDIEIKLREVRTQLEYLCKKYSVEKGEKQ